MADDDGNEDQWLYGDSNTEAAENESPEQNLRISLDEKIEIPNVPNNEASEDTQDQFPVPEPAPIPSAIISNGLEEAAEDETSQHLSIAENGVENGNDEDEDDEDDSDDDVNVIINDIKTSPTYTSLNIKRGGLLTSVGGADKLKQPGKFTVEEFDSIGSINGVPAHEFNLDSLEEKPWRKPGADITDYFNYGFNEETWRAYCERQKRIRIHESGVGLIQVGNQGLGRGVIPVSITNDNSKYSGFLGLKKAGPPPSRKVTGVIDVIGTGGVASRRTEGESPPKENVIQVMTADRREYSRKQFPDMSVPPPIASIPARIPSFDMPPPPHGLIPPAFPPPNPPLDGYDEFYATEADSYYQNYEPTQDLQWNDPTWQPTPMVSDVKVISPVVTSLKSVVSHLSGDNLNQDSQGSEDVSMTGSTSTTVKDEHMSERETRERTRDRGERSDKSDRHRDRSHRHRDKSRSRSTERRSRRHRSRSRSPGHRSHRKKKSRRSDRERSREESE